MVSTLGIFIFVIVQRASVPWFLQQAKVGGQYPFSTSSIVVSSTFAEIVLGVGLACASRGFLRGVADTLNPREFRKWWALGISQAAGDMLELYANRFLDASTYQVLLQSKLLVTALLLTAMRCGQTQSALEWVLLITLSLGLTTYSILSNGSGAFSILGTVLAVFKVVLSCVNAVCTEKILKKHDSVPIIDHIVHMKVFWCAASAAFMAALEGPEVFAPDRFFHGWNFSVLVVIATYIIKNWSGTFVLKRLDSLLKNIAEAFAMLALYLLELSPFVDAQKSFEAPTFCVTMMVVLLVWAYLESKRCSQAKGKWNLAELNIKELFNQPLKASIAPWTMQQLMLKNSFGLLPFHHKSGARVTPAPPMRIVPNRNAAFAGDENAAESSNSLRLPKASSSQFSGLGQRLEPSDSELKRSGSDLQMASARAAAVVAAAPPDPKLQLDAQPLEEKDLEAGVQQVAPFNPSKRAGSMENATFGVLDTVQRLLVTALDADSTVGENGEAAWRSTIKHALGICQGLRPYLETMSSGVSAPCLALAMQTQEVPWEELYATGKTLAPYSIEMMATDVQGQMLSFFCSMLSARRVLEVGMFTGFSTLCMAEATQAKGKVVTIEKDPFLVEMARKNFETSLYGHKIQIETGDASEVIAGMGVAANDEERFDLIFIDADKTQYAQYFQLIIDQDLLAPGGLMLFDDILWKGTVYSGTEASDMDRRIACEMHKLNQAIANDPRLVTVVLPTGNGLSLVRRLDAEEGRDHFGGELRKPVQKQRRSSAMQRRGGNVKQSFARQSSSSPSPRSHHQTMEAPDMEVPDTWTPRSNEGLVKSA